MTRSAAIEGAPLGVRINAVAPGPIETGMLNRFTGGGEGKKSMAAGVPLKRIGASEEIASAIVYAASDKASFMTGSIVSVDGGIAAL